MAPDPAKPAGLPRWPGLLAAAIAIAANLWTLRLGFIQDDFPLVSRVSQNFVPEPWLGSDPCSGDRIWFFEEGHPIPGRFMFRVTAWALWWVLVHGAGGVAHAALFHGALLLIHGATALLLCRFLQRATGTIPALLAAVVFATEPGSSQALTWAAAAGDLLAVMFLILSASALQLRRLEGRLRHDVLAGIFFALACGSKESALFFGPAVLLALLTVKPGGNAVNRSAGPPALAGQNPGVLRKEPAEAGGPNGLPPEVDGIEPERRPPPLWRLVPCFVIPLALLVIGRHAYTGEWIPSVPPSQLKRDHAGAFEFLAQALAPWQPASQQPDPVAVDLILQEDSSFDTRTLIRLIGAALVLLPCLLGVMLRPRWVSLRLLAIFVTGAIGMFPILTVLLVQNHVVDTNALSRAAHPFFPLIAIAIGLSLFAARDVPKWISLAVLTPLLVWQVDFLVHVARIETARSEAVAMRLSSFAEIVANGPADARFVAVDPEYSLGVGIEHAFRPPFFPRTVPVTWVPRSDYDVLSRLPCLAREQRPLVVARIGDGSTFAKAATVPPIPAAMPELTKVKEDAESTTFRLPDQLSSRALAAMRVRVKAGASSSLTWGFGASFGTTMEFSLPAGELASIIVDLHGDEFSLEPDPDSRPTTIEFSGGARIDGTPVALSRFPEITLSAPLQAELEVPPLSWTTVPEAARHEVELRIRVGAPDETIGGLIAPDEATLGRPSPQVRTLTLDRGVSFATAWEPGLWKRHAPRFLSAARRVTTIPWGEVWPAIVLNARTKDLNWVPVEFRVTAYDRHGAVAGQSDWGAVYIVMPGE